MNDTQKSKAQLLKEVKKLKNRVSELEQFKAIPLDIIEERSQVGEVRQLERNFMMSILDVIPDGIYIVNQQYEIEYINTVIKRKFGHVKGRKCFEYFHDRTEICPWCKNNEVFAGETVMWEWYFKKNKQHYELVDMPFKNADGSISKFEIFHDITARKQVEEMRQHRHEKIISATCEHMSFIDKNYIYKSVNAAYLKAHQKTVLEMIGHSVADLLGTDIFEEFVKERLDRCLDGEEIHYHEWFDFPGQGKCYMEVTYYPYIEKDGTVSGIVVSSHDITKYKQAEEALRKNEEKYRLLTEKMKDVVVLLSPTGELLYVSPAVTEFGGYDPESEIGSDMSKYFENETDAIRAAELLTKVLKTRQSGTFEFLFKAKDRKPFPVEHTYLPIAENNKVIEIQLVLRDITERKQAEEALKDSEESYKNIFDNNPLPLCEEDWSEAKELLEQEKAKGITFNREYFDENPEFLKKCISSVKVIRVNRATLDLFKYKTSAEMFNNIFNEKTIGTIKNELIAVANDESSFKEETELLDSEMNLISVIVQYKIAGNFKKVIFSATDITERKEAEEALKVSEEKFKAVADFTHDWEYWLNPDFSYNYVSPSVERITGYRPQEFYDDKEMLKNIIHPDNLSLVIGHQHRCIGGETGPIDFKILTKKGEIRWIGHVCREVINEEGELLGRRGSNRDITARVLAEQEKTALRERLMKTRNMETIAQLAGGIAHDFNNALMAVMGNIELLNMRFPDNETVQKLTSPMKNSAERMARLTSQMLAYARGGKYQPEKILFEKLIEKSIPSIKYSINPAIKLTLDAGCGTNQIEADSTQLQMVLSVVITNSVEAIEDKGIIKVSVRQSKIDEPFIEKHPGAEAGSYICLCVKDNGCGMEEETLEKIFEPFFTTKFQGRGLGMASVYGIVKNHNGYITVDSEPGGGTKVQIFFPLLKVIVEEEPVELSAPEKGSWTIFLIEDEEFVMEVGIKLLEHLGYRTLSAKNGEEALHIVKTFDGTIDLTLLDMGLPDIPGEVLYFHLKEARPDLEVIVCSGYTVDGPAQKVIDAGALDFIQKPYSLSSLSQVLSKYLKND